MKAKLCCVIIGHSFNNQGARNEAYNKSEYLFNDQLAYDIEKEFLKLEHPDKKIKVIHRETYKTLPNKVNYFNPTFAIALHGNAFNTKCTGSEVLFYGSRTKTKALANIFNDEFKKLYLSNRGVKNINENERGSYLLKNLKCSAIICEPFFIDNENDMKYIKDNYDLFVDIYVNAIKNAFNIF